MKLNTHIGIVKVLVWMLVLTCICPIWAAEKWPSSIVKIRAIEFNQNHIADFYYNTEAQVIVGMDFIDNGKLYQLRGNGVVENIGQNGKVLMSVTTGIKGVVGKSNIAFVNQNAFSRVVYLLRYDNMFYISANSRLPSQPDGTWSIVPIDSPPIAIRDEYTNAEGLNLIISPLPEGKYVITNGTDTLVSDSYTPAINRKKITFSNNGSNVVMVVAEDGSLNVERSVGNAADFRIFDGIWVPVQKK